MPVYCNSPSLSGLNLESSQLLSQIRNKLYILFDRKCFDGLSSVSTQYRLRPLHRLVFGFVYSAISTTTDEAHNIIVVVDSPLASITHGRHLGISRL